MSMSDKFPYFDPKDIEEIRKRSNQYFAEHPDQKRVWLYSGSDDDYESDPEDEDHAQMMERYEKWLSKKSDPSDRTISTRDTHSKCSNNEDAVQKSKLVGCFQCMQIFDARAVTKFVQSDAICPKCGIDSVLPDATQALSQELLAKMNAEWFGTIRAL